MATVTEYSIGNYSEIVSTDFDQLRAEGIRHIQRLAGHRWTDYNTHDPGITLLELLCYALTDLDYRSSYAMPDLLAGDSGRRLREEFGPEQILPVAPVTVRDLRKRLIDLPGVSNAWIVPVEEINPRLYYHPYDKGLSTEPIEGSVEVHPEGLYRVLIARTPSFSGDPTAAAREVLQACRPLTAEWTEVEVLSVQEIVLTLDLEIAPGSTQPQMLAQQVFQALAAFIAPAPPFEPYSSARRRGVAAERRYEGPLLQSGYLSDEAVDGLQRQDFLRASDLIQVIMDVPGILAVKRIRLGEGGENWLLPIDPAKIPLLAGRSRLTLFQEGRSLQKDPITMDSLPEPALPLTSSDGLETLSPEGRDRQLGRYYPARYHLPAAYGVGEGIAWRDQPGSARQLSAYLLFFEQLLADYFAQLDHARRLFDLGGDSSQSYVVQVLRDIPGVLELLGLTTDDDPAAFAESVQQSLQTLAEPTAGERLNRLLDHLLARFAESFADYALLMTGQDERLVQDKRAFLREYPALSSGRGLGFNSGLPVSTGGLERRIARLMGIPLVDPGSDQPQPEECFFLVEHLLLRPVPQDLAGNPEEYLLAEAPYPDPYSRQLTCVFTRDGGRFAEEEFRTLFINVVRRELPAYAVLRTLPLSGEQMQVFAEAYLAWRKALAQSEGINNHAYRVARDGVVDLLADEAGFILGWSRPILDLEISVPLVAPRTRAPITIHNSQKGVVYSLYDRKGQVISGVDAVTGTGGDIVILLPELKENEDKTFLVKAEKRGAGDLRVEGFLQQKVRARIGIDTNLPVRILTPEIDFKTVARLEVGQSQAQVKYRLTDPDKNPLSEEVEGQQGQAIVLTSQVLEEDTTFLIQATRSYGNTVKTETIQGTYPVRVRANPGLTVTAATVVVDYQAGTDIGITKSQKSVRYQLLAREVRDEEFIHTDIPAKWDKNNLQSALAPLTDQDGFAAVADPAAGSGSTLKLATGSLKEDTRFWVNGSKEGHQKPVLLQQPVAVLVMPNPGVQIAVAEDTVASGSSTRIRLIDPQPGVRYSLLKAGEATELAAVYYHDAGDSPRGDGVDRSRVEFDLVVGPEFSAPLELETPAITATTTFEIQAEKIQTGLKVKLTATAIVAVTPP